MIIISSSWNLLPGIILWMCRANERRHYNITSPLIGWACSQNDPCITTWCEVSWALQILENQYLSWVVKLLGGAVICNFKSLFLLLNVSNSSLGTHYEIAALRWIWKPQNLINGKSTLVQVMAWCRQAPSHYLSQCWYRSLSPYGITGP